MFYVDVQLLADLGSYVEVSGLGSDVEYCRFCGFYLEHGVCGGGYGHGSLNFFYYDIGGSDYLYPGLACYEQVSELL